MSHHQRVVGVGEAPTFSPIVHHTTRKAAASAAAAPQPAQPSSSRRNHSSSLDSSSASLRPKYQCPACMHVFVKWSPCLAHLREQHLDLYAHLLDKKQNGGDFRRVQEWCASQLKQQQPMPSSSAAAARGERTDSWDSLTSVDSLAPSTPPSLHLMQQPLFMASSKPSQLKSFARAAIKQTSMALLKKMEDRVIFCIFSFLDVDSAQSFYLAMEEQSANGGSSSKQNSPSTQSPPHPQITTSRVRIWSNASCSSSDTRL